MKGGGRAGGGDNMVTSTFGEMAEKMLAELQAEEGERFVCHFRWPVACIESHETRLSVRCENGATHVADLAIVTIPLGVLKRGHTTLFRPNLPDWKVGAINSLGVGTVGKLFLLFDSAFWRSGKPEEEASRAQWHFFPDMAASSGGAAPGGYRIFLDLSAVLGVPVLVGFAGGLNATAVEEFTEQEAVGAALQTLESGWRLGRSSLRSRLVSSVKTSWGNDRFSYGAYSFLRANAGIKDRALLQQSIAMGGDAPNVFFAGEHTSAQWAATVHGAIDTGIDAAEAVLASYDIKLNVDKKLKRSQNAKLKDRCVVC